MVSEIHFQMNKKTKKVKKKAKKKRKTPEGVGHPTLKSGAPKKAPFLSSSGWTGWASRWR